MIPLISTILRGEKACFHLKTSLFSNLFNELDISCLPKIPHFCAQVSYTSAFFARVMFTPNFPCFSILYCSKSIPFFEVLFAFQRHSYGTPLFLYPFSGGVPFGASSFLFLLLRRRIRAIQLLPHPPVCW